MPRAQATPIIARLPLLLTLAAASAGAAPPAAEQLAAFAASPEDVMPERLRHIHHYLVSNEPRLDLFRDQIAGLGGGYVGVGSDQSLLFLPWMKAEFAWLTDYDDYVVGLNRLHWLFLERAATVEEFLALWAPGARERVRALVTEALSPAAWRTLRGVYLAGVPAYASRVRVLRRQMRERGFRCYLDDPEQYQYLRRMALERRVRALNGNLFGDRAFVGIGAAARRMGVPVRVLYLSNAEQYLSYNRAFRHNVLALPFDERSLVIRTYPIPPVAKNRYYYNVQPGLNFAAWMERGRARFVYVLLRSRTPLRPREEQLEELTRVEAPPPTPREPEPRRPGSRPG